MSTTDLLLGRRLDRLRTERPRAVATPAGPRVDYSADLAAALGGRVVDGLVEVTSVTDLSPPRLAGDGLPYRVEDGRPLVCLDLETTGLATAAGTLAFLVGLGRWEGGRLVVTQLLLTDHAREHALLDVLTRYLPTDAWLVTYNGRTFDWPLLVARFRVHRRNPPPLAGHLDLLTVARQLWKHRTGDARLATIEAAICSVRREHDLPGALIPDRYFTYLRTRRAELLADVVEHNRQDIASLGQMLSLLATDYAPGQAWRARHPGDLAGLARAYLRRGRFLDALACVESALDADAWSVGVTDGARLRRELSADRARLLARLGRRGEAQQAWLEIAARGGPGAAAAWLHVARYREHVARDLAGAIEACREAAAVAERARAWGQPMFDIERDLAHRLARLRRRSLAARRFSGGIGRAA